MNELINMIAKINGGNMFEGQKDKDIDKEMDSDIVRVFIDMYDKKYYFFAEYLFDGQKDNWNQIQRDTVFNDKDFGETELDAVSGEGSQGPCKGTAKIRAMEKAKSTHKGKKNKNSSTWTETTSLKLENPN